MRLYHLADVLTLLRGVAAAAITVMAFCKVPVEVVLVVYLAGWLTDALDGPCARRWHYPQDGKRRLWREGDFSKNFDKVVDIGLSLAIMMYFLVNVSSGITLCVGATLILFCLWVEIWRHYRVWLTGLDDDEDLPRKEILMLRRYFFIVTMTIIVPVTLVFLKADWPLALKMVFMIALALALFVVARMKLDRISEVNTPLK